MEVPFSARFQSAGPGGGWLDRQIHRRLTIHTKGDKHEPGKSYSGVVTLVADDGVVLWAAQLLDKTVVQLDGEVWIPRENIHMVQTDRQ